MIDIHTHILPGMDDGARDLEDALEMAALSVQSGVRTVVATSHANSGGFFKEYSVQEYMDRLEMFREALKNEKIELTVLSGMEIFTTDVVPELIEEGKLISLNESSYYLMEFPFHIEREEMNHLIDRVMDLDIVPVIAHPERYACVQESARDLFYWLEQGCLTQVNRGSVFGRFGERAKRCVDRLLDREMVTCIASDAHKPYERTTFMADIREYMEREYSLEYSRELLYENPRRILEGEKIEMFSRERHGIAHQ